MAKKLTAVFAALCAVVALPSLAAAAPVVGAQVDVAQRVLRFKTCTAEPCVPDTQSASVPITLEPSMIPGASDARVAVVDLGDGQRATHVRVPAKGASGEARSLAWEAILAEPACGVSARKIP